MSSGVCIMLAFVCLDHSPWAVSLLARGSASDEQVRVGGRREGVGVPSEQPFDVGGARGWISTVTCIGPCGGTGDASNLL